MAKDAKPRNKHITLKPAKGKKPAWGKIAVGAVAAALLAGGVFWAAAIASSKLSGICDSQAVVESVGDSITVNTGLLVKRGTILAHFGLTNNVNLATIPFESKRKEFLELFKQVRDIRIERRGAASLVIDVAERIPVARIMSMSTKTPGTRVADHDGYVFNYPRSETTNLPIVRDPTNRIVRPGGRLTFMAAAALRLAEEASNNFRDLGIVDINTSSPYYLEATLSSGALARIAWLDMTVQDPVPDAAVKSMRRQLTRLLRAIESDLSPNTTVWTATDFSDIGRVTGNDPARAE